EFGKPSFERVMREAHSDCARSAPSLSVLYVLICSSVPGRFCVMPQEVTELAGGKIGRRSTGQGSGFWCARAGGEDALRGAESAGFSYVRGALMSLPAPRNSGR